MNIVFTSTVDTIEINFHDIDNRVKILNIQKAFIHEINLISEASGVELITSQDYINFDWNKVDNVDNTAPVSNADLHNKLKSMM